MVGGVLRGVTWNLPPRLANPLPGRPYRDENHPAWWRVVVGVLRGITQPTSKTVTRPTATLPHNLPTHLTGQSALRGGPTGVTPTLIGEGRWEEFLEGSHVAPSLPVRFSLGPEAVPQGCGS